MGAQGRRRNGATGERGLFGPPGGVSGATGGTGPTGHKGRPGDTGASGADGKIPLDESHTVVTLELVWPACLTLLLGMFTTFLLVRYRRVMTDLQTQRKTYTVQYRTPARAQSVVTVASTDTRLADVGEFNYAAMDASSLKGLTKYQ
ncbi:hypothetical protein NP493_503g00006 [Ridgeia piscesae]|uniref:Uncharacterized protein n=1 Tax=Ridgeia piscesae TaxID=27915 RepID=A0AAD9KXP4_RIDPI|nr:hypothetical protein NP493_503g00006 [Ridgeia piscesae]